MVSMAERQNWTGRTSWKRWKIFRIMSKSLQNQCKTTHPIDHNMKEAVGGMNTQSSFGGVYRKRDG